MKNHFDVVNELLDDIKANYSSNPMGAEIVLRRVCNQEFRIGTPTRRDFIDTGKALKEVKVTGQATDQSVDTYIVLPFSNAQRGVSGEMMQNPDGKLVSANFVDDSSGRTRTAYLGKQSVIVGPVV